MTILEGANTPGYKAVVNQRGHLAVSSVAIEESLYVTLVGNLGFSVDTGQLTIPANFSGPVLMIENADSSRDMIVKSISVVIDAASAGAAASAYRNPTVTTLAANDPKVPLNNNYETNVPPEATVDIWNNATGLAGMTGITPVTDGVTGPLPFPASGQLRGGPAVLGQTNRLAVNITSGVAGFECNVFVGFYYDTTGVK